MDRLKVYKKYFETASDNEHLVMHRGYALALVKLVEELREENNNLKDALETIQGAYWDR